jgi:hypothetical protein
MRAYAERALYLLGERARPAPEVLALAADVDRLRRTAPRWWARVDLATELRLRSVPQLGAEGPRPFRTRRAAGR